MLLRLAFRNLQRNGRRTMLTAGGIALCTFFVILALTHLMGALFTFEEDLLVTTGHARIVHREYIRKQRLMSLRWHVANLGTLLPKLRASPGIAEVAPRISCGVMVDVDGERQHGTVCVAIDPTLVGERRRLERALYRGSYAPFLEAAGTEARRVRRIIVGKGIAEKLGGLQVGSLITVIYRSRTSCIAAANYRICGLVDMKAGQLNRFVYVPRDDMAELVEMKGRATELLVFAHSTWNIDKRVEQLRGLVDHDDYTVQPWDEVGILGSALNSIYRVFGIVIGVILVVAGIGVGNTMIMAVLERTREIGVLQAMGFQTRQIVVLFLLEGCMLGLVGALWGTGLGLIGGTWLENHGLNITTTWAADVDIPVRDVIYGRLTPDIVAGAALLGLLVAIIGSVGPAFRAARLRPADALRSS